MCLLFGQTTSLSADVFHPPQFFFLIPYFNLGTVLRRGGKRITMCSALVQQCERLDTEQKYIVFWGTRSELMANWKVSQNPIQSGVVHQGRVGSGGRSCACFCFQSCVKLTWQNCIRTFILIHFYWDCSSRRATVYGQSCTNLTLPLMCFVSFVSLLFSFFLFLPCIQVSILKMATNCTWFNKYKNVLKSIAKH